MKKITNIVIFLLFENINIIVYNCIRINRLMEVNIMQEVYDFIIKKTGIKYGDYIVLGISGGPDSMVLLHIFNDIKKELDLKLVCAHVNHNLRKESAEEKEFIEKYCANHGIIFEYYKIENYGEDNFHNEARSIRYKYFEDLIKKYNAKFLVTAHHGDDLMETILMRIARGSTLKGYSGFEKIVDREFYQILRPLITKTKDEIAKFAKDNKIEFRIDKSNFKEVYTRNRYRKYVLPFFKNEDPNVHKKFLKFSETLLEYNDFINKEMRNVLKKVEKKGKIQLEEFNKIDPLLKSKIIYSKLEDIYNDDLILITDAHVNLIFNLIDSNKENAEVHLPNNIIARKEYKELSFKEKKEEEAYEIEIIDYANLPNGKNIEKIKKSNMTNNFYTRLSSKEVKLPLYVRTRKNGDKISIKGMLGSKKVNDIFINEKIKQEDRNLWPIVCDADNRIVWLPGLKKSKFDKALNEEYDIVLKYY